MPTRNVNLTKHFDRFVEEQVASGQFKNASDVMRAGLRLLEQQSREDQEKIEALRVLAAKGFDELDQGCGLEIDGEKPLSEFVSRIGRRVSKSKAGSARTK